MHKLTSTTLMLIMSMCLFAKNQNEVAPPPEPPAGNGSAPVFTPVEQQPEFPGGTPALLKFIQQNVQYPKKERRKGIQGKVLIRFVVDENGYVQDVHVVRGVSPGLDEEAARVVKMLPRFGPGQHSKGAGR